MSITSTWKIQWRRANITNRDKLIPQKIIDKYDPDNKKNDGYIYVRVKKGMYGLVQVGIIAHEDLKEHLKPYSYAPTISTQRLWTYQDRNIHFYPVVEKFGIKYKNKKDSDHLIAALQEKY